MYMGIRKNDKRIGTLGLAFLLAMTMVRPALGEQPARYQISSEPAIQGRLTALEGGSVRMRLEDESILSPMPQLQETKETEQVPAAYDLRKAQGRNDVSSVKDQKDASTGWTFAAAASLESNLMKKADAASEVDLSERHLAWSVYHGENGAEDKSAYGGGDTFTIPASGADAFSAGGGRQQAAVTLARWYGAAAEKDAPYEEPLAEVADPTVSRIHMANAYYLPETAVRSGKSYSCDMVALTEIKKCIMENGAVAASYYEDEKARENSGYYEAQTCSYFYPGEKPANQGIAIVGWDDGYEQANFAGESLPEGPGAWIVKNSRGREADRDGYFYLSYYDRSLCDYTLFEAVPDQESGPKEEVYRNIYQYDGVGTGELILTDAAELKFANRYTARGDEIIKAVGLYTLEADTMVDVSVYRSSIDGIPESGQEVYHQSTMIPYAGFHTLPMENGGFSVKAGEDFTVVASAQSGGHYQYLQEAAVDGSNLVRLDYEKGQSYYWSEENGTWQDAVRQITVGDVPVQLGNACIKVYSDTAPDLGISKLAITEKDAEGKRLLTQPVYDPDPADANKAALSSYASSITLSMEYRAENPEKAVILSSDGTQYEAEEDIPRKAFEQGLLIHLDYADGIESRDYRLKFSLSDTELTTPEQVIVIDNKGIVPQDMVLSSAVLTEGSVYEAAYKALEADVQGGSFVLYQLSAQRNGEKYLPGGAVQLEFPYYDTTDEKNIRLYSISGTGSAAKASDLTGVKDGRLMLETDVLNGLYAVAVRTNIPTIPKMPGAVYDPEQKLSDIPLPAVKGGAWSWINEDAVPSADQSSYAARFTPAAGSSYEACIMQIPLQVQKAAPMIVSAGGSTLVYGQRMGESDLTASAVCNGKHVPGSFRWKDPVVLPGVDNGGFEIVFVPDDRVNYEEAYSTASIGVLKKQIDITVADQIRSFGKENQPFEFNVYENALVGHDTKDDIHVTYQCAADQETVAGTYPIMAEASAENYNVSVKPGVLKITRNMVKPQGDTQGRVCIVGNFKNRDTRLLCADLPMESDEYQMFQERAADGMELVSCQELLLDTDEYLGKLMVTFRVDPKYEGRKAYVLHYADQKMEAYETVVANARVSAEVVSLSPFGVLVSDEPVDQAAAAKAGADVTDGGKQRGAGDSVDSVVTVKPVETAKKVPMWVIIGIPAAAAVIFLVVVSIVLVRRHLRKKKGS